MGGGSGGGGSQTVSETKAEFPPEFRPLAKAAVDQILGLQEALPLRPFADPNPQGVAPLSQLQATRLGFTPNLMTRLQGQDELRGLATPFNVGLSNFAAAGGPTAGAQSSLDALAASGRVGSAQLGGPLTAPQITPPSLGGSLIPGGPEGGPGGFTLAPPPEPFPAFTPGTGGPIAPTPPPAPVTPTASPVPQFFLASMPLTPDPYDFWGGSLSAKRFAAPQLAYRGADGQFYFASPDSSGRTVVPTGAGLTSVGSKPNLGAFEFGTVGNFTGPPVPA